MNRITIFHRLLAGGLVGLLSVAVIATSAITANAAPPSTPPRGINKDDAAQHIEKATGISDVVPAKKRTRHGSHATSASTSTGYEVIIPDTASDPVSVALNPEQSITMGIANAVDTSQVSTDDAGTSLYINDQEQTATAVQITTDGVRQIVLLTDPEASSTFEVPFTLPEGASMNRNSSGGYDIAVTVDGVTALIAEIQAPWAKDANGKSLSTSYSLKNDTITQTVTTSNAVFPITADPSLLVKIAYPVGYAFSIRLGAAVRTAVSAAKGSCRHETSYDLYVCWGGNSSLLKKLDGYGGGTTYGSTYYYAKGDPKKDYPGSKYTNLLSHESAHYTQWIILGPAFILYYGAAEVASRAITGKAGCGNIFEILAGLSKGNYNC